MKSVLYKKLFCLIAVAAFMSGCRSNDGLKHDFATPPETMKTGVYWYWISDNISKEGVTQDLQAMKKAGINHAFIGNIGQGAPFGSAKLFSDEWWDVLHTTMKVAGELGIEIGMFNCPGWSQTGGPWIKPDEAMRYLTASETRLTGPGKVNVQLSKPHAAPRSGDWSDRFIVQEDKSAEQFQDVKVLAFPVPKDYGSNLFDAAGAKITLSPNILKSAPDAERPNYTAGVRVGNLTILSPDSPNTAKYIIPGRQNETEEAKISSVTLKLPQPQTARSLAIYPAGQASANVELQARVNGEFQTVKSFRLNCHTPALIVGYIPYSPIVESFPETISDEYRIVFNNSNENNAIGKIQLSPTPVLDRYTEKTMARLAQGPNPAWDEYLWDYQPASDLKGLIASQEQVVDITDKMTPDGTLNWDVPAGDWVVLRTGMLPTNITNCPVTPEGEGLEMDKLIKKPIAGHFDAFLGEVLRRIPAEDRKTFKVMVEDSWEKGSQTFTDGFLDIFKAHYGYDATPYLPVLCGHTIGNFNLSDRFLWDIRRLAADMEANNNVAGLTEVANQHGLTSWLENYGDWGFPGEFLLYGKYADEIGGEFWTGSDDMRYAHVAASCAHIYNKNKVYAESFTGGGGYHNYPGILKQFGDAAFAAGINSNVLHVYIEQPNEVDYPGKDAWFGIEFNRKNTWFSQIDLFVTYLKRCGYMLQQGLNIADAAYFIGENVPINTAKCDPPMPKGYQFDYVNADVIMNSMTVKDGKLILPHGTSYRMLVLPKLETMRPELLQKIEQLVADGAVILGPPPGVSPSLQGYPEADNQVKSLADKMWGDLSVKQRSYGKGFIFTGMDMEEALLALKIIPDLKSDNKVVYNHRSTGNKEIYFISNQSDKQIQFSPEFRQSGLKPELWNPVTGDVRPLPAFVQTGETTTIPLQLEAYESVFVVFSGKGKPSANSLEANFPQLNTLTEITSPWTVTFESDKIKRGPAEPVVFSELQDWSKNADERIRYFSGTAVYENTFTVSENVSERMYLDLGALSAMAKVKINGQYAGGAWTAPYRVDITGFAKKGENTVEIEVVNTWTNRLIGDQFLPKEERLVDSQFNPWRQRSSLRESGLLGPVKVIANHTGK